MPAESSSSEKVEESSSSEKSSSSVIQPCKTKTEDNCIYGTLYDERDGKTYKTVKIGSQEWMAENLNYSDSAKTPSLKGKSWCYDNKETECSETGLLYLWTAVIDSIALATNDKNPQNCGGIYACSLPEPMQGICPVGWHIPEVSEWRRLFAAIGGVENAGKLLKSQTSWYENGNGLDSFGFSVFSVGYRSPTGSLGDRRFYTFFWTYRIEDNGMARSIRLKYDEDFVKEIETQKYGFSVRCVKNAE
ncbi:MAG: fibrobacter succinogenes major paralogous domain-containing protein [Fibrobacter sp.]|nr:fibrobacter succinogenes major paralogous domain-containing protein [Fibrobacter sp.]